MVLTIKTQLELQAALAQLDEFLTAQQIAEESVFHSKLVLSELVGNVLRHSHGFARFQSELKDGYVQLKIYASDCFVPPKTSACSDILAESGRGLFLVDSVCVERSYTDDGGIQVLIKL